MFDDGLVTALDFFDGGWNFLKRPGPVQHVVGIDCLDFGDVSEVSRANFHESVLNGYRRRCQMR